MASTTSSTQPIRRFIKRQAVEEITGLSCSEIYRRIAAGTFPAQVILGPKSVVWIESEVMDWCDARVAESRGRSHDACNPSMLALWFARHGKSRGRVWRPDVLGA